MAPTFGHDMIGKDELAVLLNLNGNRRIADLEEEIFSNNHTTYLYLERMARHLEERRPGLTLIELFNTGDITSDKQAAWIIYWYCVYFLPDGWPAAVPIISRCDNWYHCYCEYYEM